MTETSGAPAHTPRARGARHATSALVCTIVAILPLGLLGGLAPLIRVDLGFGVEWVGVGVAVFFASSALASVWGGRLAESLGSRAALLVGTGLSAVAFLCVALIVHDRFTFAAFLALGGVGNAIIQPAANLALAHGVSPGRRGLAFGFKQAAVPGATALGGFAVPIIGVTLGWRAAFAGAALLAIVAATLPAEMARPPTSGNRRARWLSPAPVSLWLIAAGTALGTAASVTMGAYLVEASIAGGWTTTQAGSVLGFGSVAGILSRLAMGLLADRMTGGWLRLVAAMMLLGSLGFASLAFLEVPALLTIGVLLGFAAGWGYNGLLLYAVVRLHPEAPGAATGVVHAGAWGGPVVGPPLFGLLAVRFSYGFAWMTLAVLGALAAGLLELARRRIARERAAD